MGGAGGGRGLCSEGRVRSRDRPRHSSRGNRRGRVPPSIFRVAVSVGRPGLGIYLQAYPGHQFGLSRREQQLVGLIRFGFSNQEIGTRLNLSEQRSEEHTSELQSL